MKIRDLVNLASGVYKISDKTHNYTLKKKLINNKEGMMYRIEDAHSRESLCLFEGLEVDDYGYPRPNLRVLTMVGGIAIFSEDYWSVLHPLSFVSRGSFKEFVKRTL